MSLHSSHHRPKPKKVENYIVLKTILFCVGLAVVIWMIQEYF